MHIITGQEIEKMAADPRAMIREADAAYDRCLEEVAETIYEKRGEAPLILLSGPSGSGKTTTALKLEKLLDERGCETHTLSMDNYFHSIDEEGKKLMEAGLLDLESPARLDIPFMNEQLEAIVEGREVELPRYDFPTSTRVGSGVMLKRRPDELVILEGIHALNPEVIRNEDDHSTRIYVSVRTRLDWGGGLLHPSYIRLMRRMLRDVLRGRDHNGTCEMFDSVERGGERYIMPYRYRAQFEIDTFFPYELCVYRTLLGDAVASLRDPRFADILTPAISAVPPIDPALIPADSLIREFIGAC